MELLTSLAMISISSNSTINNLVWNISRFLKIFISFYFQTEVSSTEDPANNKFNDLTQSFVDNDSAFKRIRSHVENDVIFNNKFKNVTVEFIEDLLVYVDQHLTTTQFLSLDERKKLDYISFASANGERVEFYYDCAPGILSILTYSKLWFRDLFCSISIKKNNKMHISSSNEHSGKKQM